MVAAVTKVIATCLILSVSMQMCRASSIPLWELLARNEKIAYLYAAFPVLVSAHCKATAATSGMPVNQCKRSLLDYGYDQVQKLSNAQLDTLDPFQPNAEPLIWSTIMSNHPSSTLITLTTRKPLPTPPASSITILTHQKPVLAVPPAGFAGVGGGTATAATSAAAATQHYPRNPIFDVDAPHKHNYAMDMDTAYAAYPAAASVQPEGSNQQQQQQAHRPQNYLTGPLVFRVRPDGTPVEEDNHRPLPRDDDLDWRSAISSGSSDSSSSNSNSASSAAVSPSRRPNKHRKIATVSALKQQRLATLALQRALQPPLEQPRQRRQFRLAASQPQLHHKQFAFTGYHYGRGGDE